MKKKYLITQDCGDHMSVKDYIRNILGMSQGTLKNMKYKGRITVDGVPVYANFLLHAGNELTLETAEIVSETIQAENLPLDILYEDEDFLAVNKPCGMAVHPTLTHRNRTLANAVMYYYRNSPFTFRLLTRLDADTTGVCLVAKNAASAGAFSHDAAKKEYLALCVGTPKASNGVVELAIDRDSYSIIKRKISPSGKPSKTEYTILSEKNGICLVRAVPVTGRTHQIRLHLSSIGLPLYGDFLYGTEISGERTRLHCEALVFVHPFTQEQVQIKAPLPTDFKNLR